MGRDTFSEGFSVNILAVDNDALKNTDRQKFFSMEVVFDDIFHPECRSLQKIQKCIMCYDRLKEGQKPACVQVCPTSALTFGKKRELMEIARTRIYARPDSFVHKIYGEYEVGGTGWLYLSAVPFDQLGFRMDLGTTPYPEFTKDFLYAVPVVLFALPAFLTGLNLLMRTKEETEAGKE